MCANYKPLTIEQSKQLELPLIPFEYTEEVYPSYKTPLLFKSDHGLEWREVLFGLVPTGRVFIFIRTRFILSNQWCLAIIPRK